MDVKIKKLTPNAVMPYYSKDGDAGLDLTVTSIEEIDEQTIRANFGIALEIPRGYVGFIFPRSSSYKNNAMLSNCVGVVDSGYRGEISSVWLTDTESFSVGDRAAQLVIMPYPEINFIAVEKLTKSERGEHAYGSTGQ